LDLIFDRISKSFPDTGVTACSEVSLGLKEGEILALAGENGAGKSTLLKLAARWMPPDSGEIRLAPGRKLYYVPQLPLLVPEFTLLDNILIGGEGSRFFLSRKKAREKLEGLMDQFSLPFSLDQKAAQLTSNLVPLLGILAALYRDSDILLLDEPTAGLSRQESEELFNLMKTLQGMGKSLLFISHKMEEIHNHCDRVALMSKGQLEGIYPQSEATPELIGHKLFGSPNPVKIQKQDTPTGAPLYQMDQAVVTGEGRNRLDHLSFTIHEGELLAVTGIRENGLSCLEDTAAGMRTILSGSVHLGGKDLTQAKPADLRHKGVSYVPADRLIRGASLDNSIAENLLLLRSPRFFKGGWFQFRGAMQFVREIIGQFRIKGKARHPMARLSGGNVQKVILGRELEWNPRLLILSEPTWGLDLSSKNEVYQEIREIQKKGTAILLLTTDYQEALSLGDRVGVIFQGQMKSPKSPEEWTTETLGMAFLGMDYED